MQIQIHNMKGEIVGRKELRDDVFKVPFNEAVVHQAMIRQLANRRQGTVDTQTRSDVTGSGRKMYVQKHTGRARRGNAKSPILKGGGVAFGPHPRDYRQDMPKKMRRLALRCLLSTKVTGGELIVVDKLEFEKPSTKAVLDMLLALGVANSAVIATAEVEDIFVKSARNLMGIKTMPARLLSALDLLSFRTLIMTEDAVKVIEELWGTAAPSKNSKKPSTVQE